MFQSRLLDIAAATQERIGAVMADRPPGPVSDAMAYAMAGGKRLRAFLVVESAHLHGIETHSALQAAVAIEAMHCYSLVHDDLPCMDDDDLRRGRPTVHVKWDQATAVLAGDALQTLAFQLLADPACHPDAGIRLELIAGLARAAGFQGMVLGQAQDIAAETAPAPLSLHAITDLQALKTGALFEWAATAGPVMAGAETGPLARYAAALGLAFQIADDILDVTGEVDKTGKRLRKDAEAGKATFVSHLGLDGARARAKTLVEEACEALLPYGSAANALRDCAQFVISREM